MLQVAAAARGMLADALFKPGVNEHHIGVAAAAAARELVPRMQPTLAYVFEAHLRELLRSDVIDAADIAAGRTPGAREMSVAFADLVGFTRLGEEIPAEELGDVVGQMESLAAGLVDKPVTFVKTIGDAVMLVSPQPDPLIDVALKLVEAEFPQRIRVGIASGPALERAGDWYGSPVNQASRVTAVARPGSVLTTQSVKHQAERPWTWSFAGERKLKGVGEVKLSRARRPDGGADAG
jgi:adenylate cyclase